MALVSDKPDNLEQFPIIEAAKVKIVGGMSEFALEDPPDVGEKRTYIVETVCKKQHLDKIDGEHRMVCDMEQTSIYEQGKVPIVDEAQPMLFDEAMAAEDIDEDTEDGEDLPPDEAMFADADEPKRAFDPEQRLDGHGPKLFSASDA